MLTPLEIPHLCPGLVEFGCRQRGEPTLKSHFQNSLSDPTEFSMDAPLEARRLWDRRASKVSGLSASFALSHLDPSNHRGDSGTGAGGDAHCVSAMKEQSPGQQSGLLLLHRTLPAATSPSLSPATPWPSLCTHLGVLFLGLLRCGAAGVDAPVGLLGLNEGGGAGLGRSWCSI